MYQELEQLLSVSISKNKPHFALFPANIYIFTFGAFYSGDIAVLETHPILIMNYCAKIILFIM